jgi:PmbA/TldA metallopeptidase C-terminal domain
MTMRALLCACACLWAGALHALAPEDVVARAMRDELARSVAELRLEGLEKPYFLAYRVEERRIQRVAATFGSTIALGTTRNRSLRVEVRVGSPALDNTNFVAAGSYSVSDGAISADLPVDDDYTELRRQIWLATDRAYKQAAEGLARKQAALGNKTRTDETPDFSAQEPNSSEDVHPGQPLDMTQAENLVRELSAVFRDAPAVATSLVSLSAADELTRYVNSEGTTFVRDAFLIGIEATARTQADDGFALGDHRIWYRRAWSELPPKTALVAELRELAGHLTELRGASVARGYNGPVLFEGEAAAEIFSQVFAPRLLAKKRPVAENGQMDGFAATLENPFVDKLGARVLAESLSVSDEPALARLGGEELVGGTLVDDEGVPTQSVKLVEKGRLKTLLVSRSPVRGIAKSNGSFQGSGPTPHNLIVSASGGLGAPDLEAELIRLAGLRGNEYGVIVRRIANPFIGAVRDGARPSSSDGVRVEPVILAYKIFPDGHEELLRNAEIAGMSPLLFKDVLAAGREPYVYSVPFRSTESPELQVVSFAVPSLLFEEVTLRRPSGDVSKPQVAPHPFFDR